jgi:ribonuclease Z
MRCLQVLGLSSGLTSPSAYVITDTSRYLFNCGESLQRLSGEHKVRLSRVKDLFITSLDVNNICSLPGVMLSIYDKDKDKTKKRTIHGPPGISAFIESACTFMWNQGFDIIEYGNIELLYPPYHLTKNCKISDNEAKIKVIPYTTYDVIDYISLNTKNILPLVKNSSLVYIIETKPYPPKFLPQKAKDLGLPPGKMISELVRGKSVTINGLQINPEDVTEPGYPQPIIAIIDLPGLDSIQSLSETLRQYLDPKYDLSLIVHFTKKEVLLTQEYLEMLLNFPTSNNLVFDPILANPSPIFLKSEELLLKLNKIVPNAFVKSLNPLPNINMNIFESLSNKIPNLTIPNHLTKVVFGPKKSRKVDRSCEPCPLDSERILNSVNETFEIIEFNEPPKIDIPYSSIVDTSVPGSDPEVLFLGTGSMKPGSYRNVSSILVSQWGRSLLLDCGEGTYSQLVRAYGDNVNTVIQDLKAIIISHLHADHHLGTIKILSERSKITNEPIIIIAPELYRIYIDTCEKIMGPFYYEFQNLNNVSVPGINVQPVPVDHKIEAYGFVISHGSGWKLVYSGDTRPSDLLVGEGLNATILIHEATFDDSLSESASVKYHSTLGQALEVAASMNVWKVVLTHFSQRYSKIPENPQIDAIYAFDLMKFKFSECQNLIKRMPGLMKYWKDQEEEEEKSN